MAGVREYRYDSLFRIAWAYCLCQRSADAARCIGEPDGGMKRMNRWALTVT